MNQPTEQRITFSSSRRHCWHMEKKCTEQWARPRMCMIRARQCRITGGVEFRGTECRLSHATSAHRATATVPSILSGWVKVNWNGRKTVVVVVVASAAVGVCAMRTWCNCGFRKDVRAENANRRGKNELNICAMWATVTVTRCSANQHHCRPSGTIKVENAGGEAPLQHCHPIEWIPWNGMGDIGHFELGYSFPFWSFPFRSLLPHSIHAKRTEHAPLLYISSLHSSLFYTQTNTNTLNWKSEWVNETLSKIRLWHVWVTHKHTHHYHL